MKIPNFDDVDLGIIGIVLLGMMGFIFGMVIFFSLGETVEIKDLVLVIAAIFAFGSTCITGIAALVRGLKRAPTTSTDTETPPEEIEKPTV